MIFCAKCGIDHDRCDCQPVADNPEDVAVVLAKQIEYHKAKLDYYVAELKKINDERKTEN